MTTPTPRIGGIRALAFDAYGTVFDVHSAVARLESRVGPEASRLSQIWRTKQLEYSWLRSLMGRHVDFWQITGDALDYALEATGVEGGDLRQDLMEAYRVLDAYPEVLEVLGTLRERGFKTALFSNGEPEMLEAAAASAGIADLFDVTISIEAVGVFKPDPRTYQLVCDHFAIRPEEVALQSSNAWDVHGASVFGFRAFWINRSGAPLERLPGGPLAILSDLRAIPERLDGPR